MAFEQEWFELVSALVQGTDRGAIHWRRDPDRPLAFVAPFDSGEVRLASVDNDGVSPFELDLYRDGVFVEGINGRSDRRFNDAFSDLYVFVERQVSGASEVVQGLLNEIRSRL
jgi:hypothetical protein